MFPLKQKIVTRGCGAHQASGLGCATDYRASYVPLYMPFDGRVTRRFSEESGGNWIEVTDRNGNKIQFAHLSQYKVNVGTYRQGTVIAVTGNTGRITSGPHLHIQIIAPNGVRRDPATYNWDSGGTTPPPSGYKFDNDLEYGMNNGEVMILQNRLKDLGHFPSNVAATRYYGPVTMEAVKSFQRKYGIASQGVAGYGRFGPKTRAKLNSL